MKKILLVVLLLVLSAFSVSAQGTDGSSRTESVANIRVSDRLPAPTPSPTPDELTDADLQDIERVQARAKLDRTRAESAERLLASAEKQIVTYQELVQSMQRRLDLADKALAEREQASKDRAQSEFILRSTVAELQYELKDTRRDRDTYKQQRWYFGAGGVFVGYMLNEKARQSGFSIPLLR